MYLISFFSILIYKNAWLHFRNMIRGKNPIYELWNSCKTVSLVLNVCIHVKKHSFFHIPTSHVFMIPIHIFLHARSSKNSTCAVGYVMLLVWIRFLLISLVKGFICMKFQIIFVLTHLVLYEDGIETSWLNYSSILLGIVDDIYK